MALFSKRHYEALTKAISKADTFDDRHFIPESVIEEITLLLQNDNPKFDRTLFERKIYGEESPL